MTSRTVELQCVEREVKNGVTCVALRNPGVGTFAVSVAIRVSQGHEAANQHGLAYLTASCLEEGTPPRGAVELAQCFAGIVARELLSMAI